MKKLLSLAVPALLCSSLSQALLIRPAAAAENNWTGNANAFLGAKALDEKDWSPAEEQGEFGFGTDFRQRDWPVSVELYYLDSSGCGSVRDLYSGEIKLEVKTSELNAGVRKTWDSFPHVRPFIGGGLTFARASAKVSALGTSVSDSDSATGLWMGGGVYWTLNGSFNIGFDLRSSTAKVKVYNVESDAGGGHFGLLLGYHWGGPAKRGEADAPLSPLRAQPQEPPGGHEKDMLEIEKQKLEIEKQKLELEREKFEFEKQKLQKQ